MEIPSVLYLLLVYASAVEMPGSCSSGQYYEPGLLACQACPANVSMVPSKDGFSCTCEENSIPIGVSRCKRCNTTEVLSSDRRSCVPRRRQSAGGRTVCRRCPADYITVTQNFDGSSIKEINCVKCARGFKAENNVCVRCESCACGKQEAAVRGRCVPKKYMKDRPKHDETKMHPYEPLDAVRDEYFCSQHENRSCRRLEDQCVKSFYSSDLAGPCRLWIQPRITQPHGLPSLTIDPSNEKNVGEITLAKGMEVLKIALVTYTSIGGVKIEKVATLNKPCFLPLAIKIGVDFSHECKLNISELDHFMNENVAPFLYIDDELRPLPVTIRTPDGTTVQRGMWPNNRFRRYFIINKLKSTTGTNTTTYLQTIFIRIQIQKESKHNSLKMSVSMEVKYATVTSPLSKSVTMMMVVENEMPAAGIVKGLEIWGGVLGAFLSLYATVQWRGVIRRGGVHYSIIPLLAGSVSDALYFAVLFSTLYALAADAGTLKMSFPLSKYEEHMIRAFVYSAIVLKILKIAWMNWKQSRCDILFIDWSEYNPPEKEEPQALEMREDWKKRTLAREWRRLQTTRRCPPGYTACLTVIIVHLPFIQSLWQSPQNAGYQWALISLVWWCSYAALVIARLIRDRVMGSPTSLLPKLCKGLGLSLWVFQEEYYAHYVHGRNDDDIEGRSVTGALALCRIICVPQLRMVYKQLSAPGLAIELGEFETKQALLSRFLAAFIERALDGLSWVANERTIMERLLDVELIDRENGNTSVLLYDIDEKTPSCFSLTWWGQEWNLGTLDAMVFGVIFMATSDLSWAVLGTVAVWQIMTNIRSSLEKEKIDL